MDDPNRVLFVEKELFDPVERQVVMVLPRAGSEGTGDSGSVTATIRSLSELQLASSLKAIWGIDGYIIESEQPDSSLRLVSLFSNSLMILTASLQLRQGSSTKLEGYLGETLENALPNGFIGFSWQRTIDILLSFSVELALKALLEKESKWSKRFHSHDIRFLFDNLEIETQERLCQSFDERHSGGRGLLEVLEDHRCDFENWRYMESVGELYSEPDAMQGIAFALLIEYMRPTRMTLSCAECDEILVEEQDINASYDQEIVNKHSCVQERRARFGGR